MNTLKGFYLKGFNIFEGLSDRFVQMLMIFFCILFIALIVLIVYKVIKHLQKKSLQNAIYPTTLAVLLSCILMFPLTLSFNKLIRIQIKEGQQDELSLTQLKIQNLELKRANMEYDINSNALQKQISLLKASQISTGSFQNILEAALLQVPLKTKQIWIENSPAKEANKFNPFYDFYQDEYLIVNAYDINAKFGIDLKKIKIKKINDNKIQVYGIEPKYIGSDSNKKYTLIQEAREVQYKDNKKVGVVVKTDKISAEKANEIEQKNNNEFQDSLKNMTRDWDGFSKAVVKLGENFIKIIFAPVYSEIEFVKEDDGTFIDMTDYINTEIAFYNKQMESLKPVQLVTRQE